jgi:hypothetical protein
VTLKMLIRPSERLTPAPARMAGSGREIQNAHVVRREGAKTHLRTNPDGRRSNNLDDMAGDS